MTLIVPPQTNKDAGFSPRGGPQFTPFGSFTLSVFFGRMDGLVRILVVDDNPAVRHYLRSLLEQQSTWQVCDEARTGGEPCKELRKILRT